MSKKLTELTAATLPLTGSEVVYLVQGGNSRKGTTGNFYIPGGTDVAVVDGGTGSSTAADARTNLGLVIGTDVQAYSANLGLWSAVTPASYLTTAAATAAYQPLDSDLTAIAALTTTSYGRSLLTLASTTALQSYAGVREVLTANRVYYVRTDGSDSNTGLVNTAGGAFLTLQRAVDVAKTIDSAGYTTTISVGAGTRTVGATVDGPMVGGGSLDFQGDLVTPSNCTINTTSADGFFYTNGAEGMVRGFKITTTTSGSALKCYLGSSLTYGAMEFGVCANMHVDTGSESNVYAAFSYAISGGAQGHFHTGAPATLISNPITITLTGTPAFSSYFSGTAGGYQVLTPITFVGAATGKRFLAHKNGVIDVGTTSLTFLPGSIAGTTESGGKYVGDVTYPDIIGALGSVDGVMVVTDGTTGVNVKNHASGAPGTAAFKNTGTSGNTVPLLDQANTFTNLTAIQYGIANGCLTLGADVAAATLTNLTRKLARVTVPAYNTGQINSFFMGADNDGTNNTLSIGGVPGSAAFQAVTIVDFVTAAALNTTGGTSRAQIKLGLIMAGATGGDPGAGAINAIGYYVNGVKVVGARDTGWTAMTGTGSKAALAAAAAGTASAAYVQAELQGALNRIAALEARLRSLDAALITHGLIGA